MKLRPGAAADYGFALDLYLSTMKPYTEELMVWDEQKQIASFARQWKLEDVRVICVDGQAVGWLQAVEAPLRSFSSSSSSRLTVSGWASVR